MGWMCLVGIGLTELPNSGVAKAPPAPPLTTALTYISVNISKYHFLNDSIFLFFTYWCHWTSIVFSSQYELYFAHGFVTFSALNLERKNRENEVQEHKYTTFYLDWCILCIPNNIGKVWTFITYQLKRSKLFFLFYKWIYRSREQYRR